MKRSKTVKQLMALGISRNDAAAYVRVFNSLDRQGRTDMLPVILRPIKQAIVPAERHRIVEIRSMHMVHNDMLILGNVDPRLVREGLTRRLAEQIVKKIVADELICVEERQGLCCNVTEYIATLKVVDPRTYLSI